MEHILNHPTFQETLQQLAQEANQSLQDIQQEATEYIKELHTKQNALVMNWTVKLCKYLIARGYDKRIDTDSNNIEQLRKLLEQHPVAFVITHKTYLDPLTFAVALTQHGLPIPHILAGINMAFTGTKQLGKQTGVIFIRRAFKENLVYKAAIRHFLAYLIEKGNHFFWALEGTRSRTGKLAYPQMGVLKYLMEGDAASQRMIKYVPVTFNYDLIPDVKPMTEEEKGDGKKPETLPWFINYFRTLGNQNGKISIRFGDPVDVQEHQAAIIPDQEKDSFFKKNALPRFGFELTHQANEMTPISTVSLVCVSLLQQLSQTKKGLEKELAYLLHFVEYRKKATLLDYGNPLSENLTNALHLLMNANIVQKTTANGQANYQIAETERSQAIYYANTAAHPLYHFAFIELALIKIAKTSTTARISRFWEELFALRDAFRFEFFPTMETQFKTDIATALQAFAPDWQDLIQAKPTDIYAFLKKQALFIAPSILRSSLDAYQVALQTLHDWDTATVFSKKSFMTACFTKGKTMYEQHKISFLESVSRPFLMHGFRLAEFRELTPDFENVGKEKIEAALEQFKGWWGSLNPKGFSVPLGSI